MRLIPFFVLLFLAASLMDLMSLGLVGSCVTFVTNPESLKTSQFIDWLAPLGINPQNFLLISSAILAVIFLLKSFVSIFVARTILKFSMKIMIKLRIRTIELYQQQSYVDHLNRNSVDCIRAISSYSKISSTSLTLVLTILSEGIVSVVLIGALIFVDWVPVLVLTILLALVFVGYDLVFKDRVRASGTALNSCAKLVMRSIQEGMKGLKELRVLNREAVFKNRVIQASEKYGRHFVFTQTLAITPRQLIEFVILIFLLGLVGGKIYSGRELTDIYPLVAMFLIAALRLAPSATLLTSSVTQLRRSAPAISALAEDLRIVVPTRPPRVSSLRHVEIPFQSFSLKDVTFRYPKTVRPVIDQVSLNVLGGESIGLIGPSGAGKTTLVDIILGLLDPEKGEIRYNGRPLEESITEWWSHVTYLPQECFLMDDSLSQNIALEDCDQNVKSEHINQAIIDARLSDVVSDFRYGIETVLGENGVRLSGGQKQRVALARAFYFDRDVLVLDEATNALDDEMGQEIAKTIRRLKGEKTMIIIAHRLSTLVDCDRVYLLENGRIVDEGSYQDVVEKRLGKYVSAK